MPRGPKPKPPGQTVGSTPRVHGWDSAPGEGWQHGDVPAAPDGLLDSSRRAWDLWFASWWAAHWTEADLPQIEQAAVTLDRVRRGDERVAALNLLDKLGITPKGRQDLRWAPPAAAVEANEAHAAELDDLERKRSQRRKRLA